MKSRSKSSCRMMRLDQVRKLRMIVEVITRHDSIGSLSTRVQRISSFSHFHNCVPHGADAACQLTRDVLLPDPVPRSWLRRADRDYSRDRRAEIPSSVTWDSSASREKRTCDCLAESRHAACGYRRQSCHRVASCRRPDCCRHSGKPEETGYL